MTPLTPLDSAEQDYVSGQMRPGFGPLLAEFERRNVQALALPGWELDVPYAAHPREVFDLLPAGPDGLGTVLYFHAGYWQSRDKAQFRFLAAALQALGWHTALVNYPLCPEVELPGIVASASCALERVAVHQLSRGRTGPLALSGHSAGAHLAVELALKQAQQPGWLPLPLAGVLPICGIYELEPLVATTLNQRLRLDAAQARAASPVHRARPAAVPALFLVGETETAAFHAQTQAMAQAWQAQGNPAECLSVAGADHFSVLDGLCDPTGPVAQSLRAWAGR